MNKFLLSMMFIITTIGSVAFAESDSCPETSSRDPRSTFNYWNIGVGPTVIIPNVGIGRRYYRDQYGFDVSVNVGSIYYISSAQLIANALYIPNPHADCPWYFGLGAAVGVVTDHRFSLAVFTAAPNFLIGKELSNTPTSKTFVEASLQAPTWGKEGFHRSRGNNRLDFPLVSIKYGVSF